MRKNKNNGGGEAHQKGGLMSQFLLLADVTFSDGALKGMTLTDGHRASYPTLALAEQAAQALRTAPVRPIRRAGFGGTTWTRIRVEEGAL